MSDQQQRLQDFVTWWRENITGDEKGEAQIFLDHFLKAFGHKGAIEAGKLEARVRRKRNGKSSTAFADYVLPGKVLIEMKKRGENLQKHYDQLENYWKNLPNKPRYAMLCNFDELWIYDFPTQFYDPVDHIKIEDLPNRTAALEFLVPGSRKTPVFQNNLVEVTKDAAYSLSQVFKLILRDYDHAVAQRFILQCMLALFAEDIGLLPDSAFTRIIEECQGGDANSYDLITLLFTMMNTPGLKRAGRFYGVDYFNGGIFSEINPVQLNREGLDLLRETARADWAKIRPAIFGTIFEDSMNQDERHQIGAHYTTELDIKRIIDPVIVDPWAERIEAAETVEELIALHGELCNYQVIDPACGSGNFLYVAYREMKKLEARIIDHLTDLEGEKPQFERLVSSKRFWGFDINAFAVELAKVTLMIAKKLAVDETHSDENPLPLDNLDANIRREDALFNEWPRFDACISNPPYMGAKRLKQEHSTAYINRVRAAFPDVPGNADYCVYWFRKAHELMQPGTRAGMVGTNTIRQNYSRQGGLDYIVANDGHIFDAISTMPWSGEANVHVSIACWSKGKPPVDTAMLRYYAGTDEDDEYVFREVEMPRINSALSEKADVSGALILKCNTKPKKVFQGQIPGNKHFVMNPDAAREMIKRDRFNSQVIFPFLIGRDLTANSKGKPTRYVIDFTEYDLVEAQNFKAAYAHVKKHILPVREKRATEEKEKNERARKANPKARINRHHENFLNQWWKQSYGRTEMLKTIGKKRYVVCSEVTKRPIFDFVSPKIRPDHTLIVFCFEDDYSFGILQSDVHWQWFTEKGSTLTERYRYTPSSVFDTFPWPQKPTAKQVQAVAEAARTLHEFRRKRMANSETLTLRDMYRTMELPGKNPLKDLHTALDKAVMAAYGFDEKKDVLAQLLTLNETVAAKIEAGEAVTAPGVPTDYPAPEELVSEGCIQPPELI
jgi:hypothetical protein